MNVETVQEVSQETQEVVLAKEETICAQEAASPNSSGVETAPSEVSALEGRSESAAEGEQNSEQSPLSDVERANEEPQSEDETEVVTEKTEEVQEGETDLLTHYKEIIADAEKLYEELIDRAVWIPDSDKDGIKGYTKLDEATGLKMARGEGVINKPAELASKHIMDPSSILKWEGNLVSHQIVENVEEFAVIRSLDKKRAFVSQRETLLLTRVTKKEDGTIVIVQKSFSHSAFPEKKDYVRAHVNLCSWTLTPDQEDPNKTNGTYMIFVDPKGWVPKPVFNAFVSDQTTNIKKIRNYVQNL